MTSPARLPSLHDPGERLPNLLQIRRLGVEPEQTGLGVEDRRGHRLADLVSDRGGELPHRRDAVRVRQRGLHLAISLLAFAQLRFGAFAFSDVDRDSGKEGRAPRNRHQKCLDLRPDYFPILAQVALLAVLNVRVHRPSALR